MAGVARPTIDVHLVVSLYRDPDGKERFKVRGDDGGPELVDLTAHYSVAATTAEDGRTGFVVLLNPESFPIGESGVDDPKRSLEHCGLYNHPFPCNCYLEDSIGDTGS